MSSELLSASILIALVLVAGVGAYAYISTLASEYVYQDRVRVLAQSAKFDLESRSEYYNSTHIFLRIIRIGSLDLGGILPLVSLEATNTAISDPTSVWLSNDLYVMGSASYIYYSQPIDPTKGYPPPGSLQLYQCSNTVMVKSTAMYVYRNNDFQQVSDLSRNTPNKIQMCILPQPPVPMGHLLVGIAIPPEAQNYRFYVVSIWILIGMSVYNIDNIVIQTY
jgi:hypothetical protein